MAISYGTYTITEVQEGSQIWTSSAAPTTPNYTFDVSKLVGDSETSIKSGDIIMHSYNRYTVLSISSDGKTVLAGNLQSIRGATGAASVTYALIVSNLAIVKDKDGNLSPSTITVTAKSQTGSNAMANYTGRIKIETTTNNSTWTSRINEDAATKTYTIPSDTVAIRCSLYLKGGTTTLLDQQTVPIVSDGTDGINGTNGKDGANGKDAYTVILTNENHTFAGNTTSAIASEIECNVIAYKGTTQIAATIGTITGQPTGMTTEILNNGKTNTSFKVKVTASMTTKNGVLNIPITVDGKSFTKEFTYTLTLDGEKGDKGDRGTNGASQNLLLDAYAPSLAKVDAPSARYFSDASNSTITGQFIAEDNLPDPNATHFVRLTDSSASTKGRGLCFYSSGTPPFINGHTYRIGCWVRKHAGSPKMNITLGSYGSWMPTQRIIDNTDWEWIEVVRTFGDTTTADKAEIPDTYKRLYFYFYNNNVAGSSLDMCGFKMEEVQTNSGTARNLLLGTEKLTNWGVTNGTTISNGVITFPYVSSDTWREVYPAKNFKYDLIKNQYAIFSIKVKGNVKEVNGELVGEKCCINLGIGVDTTETAYIRKKFLNQYVYFTGTGEWQTVCSAIPIFDYMFTSGTGTVDFDNCWVTVRIGAVNNYWNGFQAKEPQLCLGTTATSWSRAPEDFDEAIDNIEVGGRNLVRNTAIMPTTKINGYNFRASGGTVTHVDLDNSPINGITGAIRITNTNSSPKQVGMAQDSLKNCFIVGEVYTMSCWVRASTDIDVVFQTIWASNERTTGSSGTILGYKFKAGTDWTYLKWEGATLLGTQVSQYSAGYVYGTNVPANGWLEVCGLKVEKGNKATAWTPAPEDIEASAVTEEQYIYIQATSGTNSVNPTTTWVTENGESTISDTQGLMPVWTTKRPTYRTNYPVIFIAKQKKTVDGTITCTTPIKDDTLTIIDGGHITTGTIDASKVTVTNIDAGKITTGTLKAERINTKSISIGDFKDGDDYAKTEDVNTAIDNIEIGGRNLLKESDCLAPIQTSKGITITYNGNGWFNVNGTVTGTSAGVLCFYGSGQHTSNISGSGEYTLSIETDGTIFLPSNKTWIQLAYHSDNATNNNLAGDFKILSGSTKVTFTIPENHHISRVCLFIQANATDSVVDGNIRLKLEKGNKATDWTPAPEDVINEAVNKVEVGGRNLIRNSTNFNKWVVQNGGANGDIWSRSVSGNTSNVNLRPRTWIGTGNLADYYNKTLVVSFEIMSPDWSAIEEGSSNTGLNGLAIQLETANGVPYSSSVGSTGRYFFKRLGDKNYFKTDSALVDGKWVKITSVPLKIDDTLWNNNTTLIDGYDNFTFSFLLRRNGEISLRKPQIELGNKATDFTLAPEDIEVDIEEAKKVATNYLSADTTGIMVADMNDGEQTPSTATGRNVFIDNDSVDIRNGTTTLASFTGDNTKFYDPIYKKELATFGTSGAIIGANNEQRFVIEKDGIKSINDSGATVFSVNSTNGTVVTEAQVASGGESVYLSGKTVVFDTVGTGFTTNTTFYTKKLTAIIGIRNSAKPLTNVKVNSVTATSTLVDSYSGYWYSSTHSINLSPFTFTYGTSKRETYQITASFVNDYGDSYNLTAQASINYDGNVTLTVQLLTGECVRISGNNEDIARMDLIGSKIVYGEIYQSSAYTKAPAMTFGTRGKNAILAPFSVTIGEDLYANNDNQLSIGRYNLNNDEFFPLAFAIGNGVNDTDRSNAFNVDWDGNTEIAGNLTVSGTITDTSSNYSLIKNLNVGTFKLSTRVPVYRKTFYWTAEIGADSGWSRIGTNASLDGYTPVGVVSFGCFNASSGASSNVDWCVITKCYVWSTTLDVYVWNQNTTASARCGVYVKVLYIANGMI